MAAKPKEKRPEVPVRVRARVTVGMAGAPRGSRVLVNPDDPVIADLITNGMLVIEGPRK